MVVSGFSQHRKPDEMLRYPWEMGALADIFNFSQDPLPLCPGLAEQAFERSAGASGSMQTQLERFLLPDDAKYVHAVKSLQDLQYFEEKTQKTDLACAQWLNILAIDWSASGIGPQLAASLQRDSSGDDAIMILKACFGVKSPSTLLKRSSATRKFLTWFDSSAVCGQLGTRVFPGCGCHPPDHFPNRFPHGVFHISVSSN